MNLPRNAYNSWLEIIHGCWIQNNPNGLDKLVSELHELAARQHASTVLGAYLESLRW